MNDFTIKFTAQELDAVLGALSQMPYHAVVNLIPAIRFQAQQQIPPTAPQE